MDQDKKPLKERLADRYRLIILNDQTLEEHSQYILSLKNLYFLLSSLLLILGFLIVCIIFFTPIKRLVPGYGSISDNRVLIEINSSLDEIEQNINAQDAYMLSFRKMLTADEFGQDDTLKTTGKLKQTLDRLDSLQEAKATGNIIPKSNQRSNMDDLSFYLNAPLSGIIGAAYDPKIDHVGIDILAPSNTPVTSIADGKVIISDWNLKTGNTIGIQHANKMLSFYKHNSALLKDEGESVRAGEAIAIVGNSGTLTDGPHLHFELWLDGEPVNPVDFIDF